MVDVLVNDTLNGELQSIIIMDNPFNGTVMIAGDTAILYTPAAAFCGVDSFSYMICNEMACDSAWVVVDVACSDFHIFTAVSPNGDGVNDYFVINGISQYDNVSVTIFNRWGNMVYELRDGRYNNVVTNEGKDPWDGTWNGKDLPDGTYFYCIELPGDAGTRTGYIQLRR